MEVIGTQLNKKQEVGLKHKYIAELLCGRTIILPNDVKNYPTQDMILVICKNKKRYLVLRFRKDYDYCPADWDFVTRHPYTGMSMEENATEAVRHHVGLNGKIEKNYPNYIWLDIESKMWWYYYPFLMKTNDQNIIFSPNGKYSEYKWVNIQEVPKFSRLNYLENALERTLNSK